MRNGIASILIYTVVVSLFAQMRPGQHCVFLGRFAPLIDPIDLFWSYPKIASRQWLRRRCKVVNTVVGLL